MTNKILWRKRPTLIGFGRKEDTKERANSAVGGIFSTRTQLKKDKKTSRNSGFCYSIDKAMAVPALYRVRET
jgi:hypothetical protein